MTAICIIPARGGSKRLPRKNIIDFHGKPIIAYSIEAARESGVFQEVCVSSDDDEILAIALQYGAVALKRPPELARDDVDEVGTYLSVLKDYRDVNRASFKYFCGLYATAPFLTPSLIRDAFVELMVGNLHAVIGSDPECKDNGSFYFYDAAHFEATKEQFPERRMDFRCFNIDINTREDYERALKHARV